MEIATAGLLAGLASAGASAANNAWNIAATNRMNARQEALMRESWSREDNAVQRRVADLKAAGLSPTLAAGSAAASSGPIKLNTPQSDLSGVIKHSLEAASAVNALRTQKLENENLKKQGEILDLNKEFYGYPDWAVAGIRMFGLEKFKDMVRSLGGSLFGNIFGSDSGSGSGASASPETDLPTDLKLKKKEVKGVETPASNTGAQKALEVVGVDTTKPKIEGNGSSYGVWDDEFEKAAKSFVQTMLNDNMVSTSNLDLLSHQLSVRYELVESDVRKYLTDLVRELRKH